MRSKRRCLLASLGHPPHLHSRSGTVPTPGRVTGILRCDAHTGARDVVPIEGWLPGAELLVGGPGFHPGCRQCRFTYETISKLLRGDNSRAATVVRYQVPHPAAAGTAEQPPFSFAGFDPPKHEHLLRCGAGQPFGFRHGIPRHKDVCSRMISVTRSWDDAAPMRRPNSGHREPFTGRVAQSGTLGTLGSISRDFQATVQGCQLAPLDRVGTLGHPWKTQIARFPGTLRSKTEPRRRSYQPVTHLRRLSV